MLQINPTKLVGFFSVAAVAIGAAVFVSWFLFGRSLENDVRRMTRTMAQLESVRLKIEYTEVERQTLPLLVVPPEGVTVRFGAEGVVDWRDLESIVIDSRFAFDSGLDGAVASGQFQRMDTGDYFYLHDVPQTEQLDLTAFADQWIFIPAALSLAPLVGGEVLSSLDVEDWVVLLDLITKIDLVEVRQTGVVEIISGDAVLPYEFVIDQQGLAVLLATWWELRHDTSIDAVSFAAIKKQLDVLGDFEGRLFIGRKSFLLHRLTLKNSKTNIKVSLSDFGLPVDVAVPEESARDVRRLLSDLGFNVSALPTSESVSVRDSASSITDFSSLPGAEASAAENDDPDDDGLDNGMEFFYGTDSNHPDTDGDGISDGEEVAHGQNPNGQGGLFSFGLPF